MPYFIVGTTGHRDLVAEEEAHTRAQVRDVLTRVSELCGGLPPKVISGLAEGADSLVAEVALDMGLDVEAVLPMPADLFKEDFEGEALEAFLGFLSNRALCFHELPLADGPTEKGHLTSEARTKQYALLKDYILSRAHVLIALWDGTENGLKGGTGDVVASFLGGGQGNSAISEIPVSGRKPTPSLRVVVWIPVSRRQNSETNVETCPVYLVSDDSGQSYSRQKKIPDTVVAHWRKLVPGSRI